MSAATARISIILPARRADAPPARPIRRRHRSPAVPIAVAFAIGISIDARWGLPLPIWLVLCATFLSAWYLFWRRRNLMPSTVALIVAVLFCGAGWHHLRWSVVSADAVHRFTTEDSQPVRVLGTLVDQPAIIPPRDEELPSAIPRYDRTVTTLDCSALVSGDKLIPVSGLARVDVSGHLLHARTGDSVDLVGRFSLPSAPANPGDFDFPEFLRTRGIHVVVRCEEPDDVRVTQSAGQSIRSWLAQWRSQAERMLAENLSERTAAVGTALLLGTRSGISDNLRNAFAESGTMHILAISGANVGVLAGLLWIVARIIRVGRTQTALLVLAGIVAYALIADAQPPVLRAVLMFLAVIAGRPWFRTTPLVNGLAVAALGILIWNPSHLFDVGAQLSFLAVGALIWAPSWIPFRWRRGLIGVADDHDRSSWSIWLWQPASRSLAVGTGTLAAISLFTIPLVIARFHVVSLVGLVVNLLVAPLVVVILWSGYGLLVVGLLFPAAATPFASTFDLGLRLLLDIVERSAAVPGGHFRAAGPSDLWLVVYYACLLAVACGLPGERLRRWGWGALLTWTVAGLGYSLVPHRPGELRCTVLAVGHGLAVMLEMPNGQTLLYDSGQMQNGRRASDVVQQTLWDRNLTRVDAVVLSHADVDHFNGIPALVRSIPVGEVFVHPSFLDFDQEAVRLTCDRLAQRKIPIRTLWAGDRLLLDGNVEIRVLHPVADAREPLDNANSVVLAIEYAGRRILLTGDLEQQGMRALLRQPALATDVLLAPHHGSIRANTPTLAAWARPGFVIVSGSHDDRIDRLREVYGPLTSVVSTDGSGAISLRITPTGEMSSTTFRTVRTP